MLFLQNLRDGVDGKLQIPQKADELQALQILIRVKPSPALGEIAGDQDPSGIIVLDCSYRDAAELGKLSRGIF